MQRRYAEADRVYESAFEQVRTSGVINGEMRRDYGLMLLRRGDTAGAETQLLQSLSSLEQAYSGTTHPNVQETKRALMTLYTRDAPAGARRALSRAARTVHSLTDRRDRGGHVGVLPRRLEAPAGFGGIARCCPAARSARSSPDSDHPVSLT